MSFPSASVFYPELMGVALKSMWGSVLQVLASHGSTGEIDLLNEVCNQLRYFDSCKQERYDRCRNDKILHSVTSFLGVIK